MRGSALGASRPARGPGAAAGCDTFARRAAVGGADRFRSRGALMFAVPPRFKSPCVARAAPSRAVRAIGLPTARWRTEDNDVNEP